VKDEEGTETLHRSGEKKTARKGGIMKEREETWQALEEDLDITREKHH